MSESLQSELRRAAEALDAADALVVTAGAGMGVDSGLPDFRGVEGFWKAYPPYAHLGLNFYELANPRWFRHDPPLAWGFYGHRLNLYRATQPHAGFAILKRWGEAPAITRGLWVITSNVDGQFQRAGFDLDQLVEIHGSIDWLQCHGGCGVEAFPAGPDDVNIDPATLRATPPFPTCPACGGLARPNILMFGDFDWDNTRTDAQEQAFARWSTSLPRDGEGMSLVVVECGAGKAVPSIRNASESLARRFGGTLIRINPRDPDVPRGHISLATSSLVALQAIDALRTTGK